MTATCACLSWQTASKRDVVGFLLSTEAASTRECRYSGTGEALEQIWPLREVGLRSNKYCCLIVFCIQIISYSTNLRVGRSDIKLGRRKLSLVGFRAARDPIGPVLVLIPVASATHPREA